MKSVVVRLVITQRHHPPYNLTPCRGFVRGPPFILHCKLHKFRRYGCSALHGEICERMML